MSGKGGCVGLSQLHSTIYIDTFSGFHSLPRQDSLPLRYSFTTNFADAPGLSWDCCYHPRLVDGWQSLEAGRSWTIGLPLRCHSLHKSDKAHLKSKMRCD